MPSEPTPAQQPDGGAEALKPCPFCGDVRAQTVWIVDCGWTVSHNSENGCGVRVGYYDDAAEARAAWNTRAPIPPASPREAVYRAVDAWLDAMEVTAKAAQISSPSSDPYMSAIFTDKLAHQRFAEVASQYRMACNTVARKESADAR